MLLDTLNDFRTTIKICIQTWVPMVFGLTEERADIGPLWHTNRSENDRPILTLEHAIYSVHEFIISLLRNITSIMSKTSYELK